MRPCLPALLILWMPLAASAADTKAPSTPTNFQVTGKTSTTVSLAWSASTDNVGVTGYEVLQGSTLVGATAGLTFTVTGLQPGTTYRFFVRARDAAGNVSRTSKSVQVTTTAAPPDTQPPTAPTNLHPTGTTSSSVSLSWNASTDNVAVTAYDIFNGSSPAGTTAGTSYTFTGLAASTTYTFTVRARDAAGNVSPPSNATTASTAPGGGGSGKKIAGYFPSWGIYQKAYYVKNVEASGSAAKLTHLNYAFANVVNGVATIYDTWAEYDKPFDGASSVDGVADPSSGAVLRGNFNQLRKLKALHPQLKILMSIGGWTLSGGFSAAAATAQSRQTFAASAVDLFIRGHLPNGVTAPGIFDGIDIDWEYPAACGLQCGPPQDTQNFTLLLAELRRQLDLQGAADGRPYLLSIAAPAGKSEYQKIELGLIHQYLDHINLMTYDFHGSWETVTNFHAPLWMSSSDPSRANGFWADYAVSAYLAASVPAGKLLLGIPFYGHGWQGVPNFNNGLYQNSAGAALGTYEAGVEDYRVLKNLESTYGKFRHNEAQAFWIYSPATGIFWSYDDPASVANKMSYINSKAGGLGGTMFWELSGDDVTGSLITAMANGLAP
jgi:chitinase